MLSDSKGIYGGLPKGHERDEAGLSYDELFKRDQRQDGLWDSSELNVRSELGFASYDHVPTEDERIRRSLAKSPTDLAYSNYHRHSELGAILQSSAPARRWDPLDGVDRYWAEHKAEKMATGDFESRHLGVGLHHAAVPTEGQVRIVMPHMDKGHQILGLGMVGLTIVQIVDPAAYAAGWRIGDEVQKVNRQYVANAFEFKEAISHAISRNKLTASPIIFDIWREPARSVHLGPPAGVVPAGASPYINPGIAVGAPPYAPYGAPMMTMHGVPMMAGPQVSPADGGLQQRLNALAQENALLKQQLAGGSRAGGSRIC